MVDVGSTGNYCAHAVTFTTAHLILKFGQNTDYTFIFCYERDSRR